MTQVELLGGASHVPLARRVIKEAFDCGAGGSSEGDGSDGAAAAEDADEHDGGARLRRSMSAKESVARGCTLAAAASSGRFRVRPFRLHRTLDRPLRVRWRAAATGAAAALDATAAAAARGSGGGTAWSELTLPAGTPLPLRRTLVLREEPDELPGERSEPTPRRAVDLDQSTVPAQLALPSPLPHDGARCIGRRAIYIYIDR